MRFRQLFPLLSWLPGYQSSDLKGDLVAGLTVGVMLIPQSMAYALLAGAPPIYGLYASLVPPLIYVLLGTSRHLAVGINAIDSLIVIAALAPLAAPLSSDYLALALVLALLVGVIQIVMGLARFGFVVALLSRPVLAGFMAAAAVTIGFSQLKSLLRVPLPRTPDIFTLSYEAAQLLGEVHLASLAIGAGGILLLLALKRWAPRAPGSLIAVALGALLVWQFRLDVAGVEIVGDIPTGLPTPAIPSVTLGTIQTLFPTALTLALVQFMSVISLGKLFADKHRYTVDANRELVALGTLNVAGSVFRSIPVSGSFSRSAVGEQAGGKTAMVNVFAALLIILTLLFLTPLFHYLPIPVFASIIMVAAFGMVNVKELRFLLRSKRVDGLIAIVTFASTLVFGIQNGVLVGMGASVVAILFRIGRPYIAELGHLPGTRSFRDISRREEAHRLEDFFILRVDASFGFANADYLRDHILRHCDKHPEVRTVLIDGSTINDLDTTATAVLEHIVETLRDRGVGVYFGGLKGAVMDVVHESGLGRLMGDDHFHLSPFRAVRHVMLSAGREEEFEREFGPLRGAPGDATAGE